MRCLKCDEDNSGFNDFCVSCGSRLRRGSSGASRRRAARDYREVEERSGTEPERRSSLIEKVAERIASADQGETSDDLKHGQMVIIAARWVLVTTGLMLALWSPSDIVDLRIQIVVILGLAGANFYLHTQVLMGRPTLAPVAYAASAADLIGISMIIFAQDGSSSGLYVFYFPAILAFSVAFRTELTLAFAGAAIGAYGLIATTSFQGNGPEVIAVRLLMLAAVAVCGNMYWRIERRRRLEAHQVRDELRAQVEPQVS